MIQAKPIIPDQYWILRDNDRKVGNIESEPGGYVLNINGERTKVKTLNMLTERMPINFEPAFEATEKETGNQVHGYPTTDYPFNAIFDVRHQLPLWTKEERSRSWLAAGWYRVKQHRDWRIVQCPKLILLERYSYEGPFHSREQAQAR